MPDKYGNMMPNAGVLIMNGEELCPVSSIPEFTETTTNAPDDVVAVMRPTDFSATFYGTFRLSKWFRNFLKYGWRAKSPVRKRLLKALRMKYPKQFTATCIKEMAENG